MVYFLPQNFHTKHHKTRHSSSFETFLFALELTVKFLNFSLTVKCVKRKMINTETFEDVDVIVDEDEYLTWFNSC